MDENIQIEAFYPEEISGSEKFKLILEIKNLGDKEIVVKDMKESLAPGKIIYFDSSSTHIDLDNLYYHKSRICEELWQQVIDASKTLRVNKSPLKYSYAKLIRFLSKNSFFPGINLNRYIKEDELLREYFPEEHYPQSFYIYNIEQLKTLKATYILFMA